MSGLSELSASGVIDRFPVPPPDLRHRMAGTDDLSVFLDLGRRGYDAMFASLRSANIAVQTLGPVLDFGCGAGRVLRYWAEWRDLPVHGTDHVADAVGWTRQNLAFANVSTCRLEEPLGYKDGTFGLVYALSTFTHMPEPMQQHWFAELIRVLRPGGVLYFTTHGDWYKDRALTAAQQARYESGQLVVINPGQAGSSACGAYHPPAYVRRALIDRFGLELLQFLPMGALGNPKQDSYLVQKPLTQSEPLPASQEAADHDPVDDATPATEVPTRIFLHIQKTAGTAIRQSLADSLPEGQVGFLYPGFSGHGPRWITLEEFGVMSPRRRSELKYLIGHLYFGMHGLFPNGAKYFTFVRDPVARVRSQYWQHSLHVAEHITKLMGCPLSEVVNRALTDEYDNLQTRMISGLRPHLVPIGTVGEAHLEVALRNLDQHFDFVGVVENMAQDWPALLAYLNLHDIPLVVENVTTVNRQKRHAGDDADYAKIDWDRVAENNRIDILLYEEIRRRTRRD